MNIKNIEEKYNLIYEELIEDIDTKGYLLNHKKSGAKVIILENDDNNKTFSIGFRTPPSDNTGVAHITEHSVLCGSKKFPLKDPFMELVKGSVNTFLNAMTYPDKTLYPVASTNDKDFHNLMDVYLDSVFNPNMYKNENIFRQEGITFELKDKDDELKYNGVVYNEMKGAFSSSADILDNVINKVLFPDNCYSVNSGGDPEFIPDLTFEDFIKFHKKYYHPSNSYIYLYGDADMESILKWIDEEYLDGFDTEDIDSKIEYQKAFDEEKYVVEEYPIASDEDEKDKIYYTYNICVGDSLDMELYVAMQALDYALVGMSGSPIERALLNKGIGKNIFSEYSTTLLQPYYSIIAENSGKGLKEEFEETIKSTLKNLVENGIDKKSLNAALNNFEFAYRENDTGSFPKGLLYGLKVYNNWIYDDNDVFRGLKLNKIFEKLKGLVDTGYFEELVKKYFLDNKHLAVIELRPVAGLNSKKEKELKEKLENIKNSLSEKELDDIILKTKELEKYKRTKSTKEELDSLPILKKEDLYKEIPEFPNTFRNIDNVKVLQHNLNTRGIGYLKFLFDITDIPFEYVKYLTLLKAIFSGMDTKKHDYDMLGNEILVNTGALGCNISCYGNKDDIGKYSLMFEITSKFLFDKLDKVYEFMEEIIFETLVEDEKRLYDIVCLEEAETKDKIIDYSDSIAICRCNSYLSAASKIVDECKGVGYYRFIKDAEENFEDKKSEIKENIIKLFKYIFRNDNLLISYTASDKDYEGFEDKTKPIIEKLEENNKYKDLLKNDESNNETNITGLNKNEGIKYPSQVQYVALTGNFKKYGYEYNGKLQVLSSILTNEYLWNNIRELGGAYGCNVSFRANGTVSFSSYRDPNLRKTKEVFENTWKYLRDLEMDERSLTKHIIGTLSRIDIPKSEKRLGDEALDAYLTEISVSTLKERREDILNVTVDDIKGFKDLIKVVTDNSNICVLGNENAIEEAKDILETNFYL